MWSDEKFNQLSIKARLFFIGIFSNADDEGFIQGDPNFLRSIVFPYENILPEEIISLLDELKKLEMIKIYGGKNGEKVYEYIHLPSWWEHQPKPDYPTPSKIANFLIDIGKLDSKLLLSIHLAFCRKKGRRQARRSRKSSDGVGVGVGVGDGLRIGDIISLFNEMCRGHFKEVKKENLDDVELNSIKLRLKKHPDLEWWKKVFDKMNTTPFLYGENKNGWTANFMWLFKNPKNCLKVFRGDYEKKSGLEQIKQFGKEQK